MALVLLYMLPMLLTFVLIPKQSESVVPLEIEDLKRSTVTEIAREKIVGKGQNSQSDSDKTRHRHRHKSTDTDTVEKLTTDVQEISDNSHETKEDGGFDFTGGNDDALRNNDDVKDENVEEDESTSVQVASGNDDVINEYDKEESTSVQGIDDDIEDAVINSENEKIIDNDDAISAKDDAISGSVVDTDTTESIMQHGSDGQEEQTESGLQNCPKCAKKAITEKEVKIEMVKQHLLRKLGLSSVPKVDDPLPPLPFDFYVGEDFAMNDEEENEKEETRKNVKTREIFIFGEDITDKCAKKKNTGCYSFNTTSSTIDPDLVSSVELWIYKQPDVNDHHIQDFMVSELEPYIKGGKEVLRFRNIVKRIETRLKYGWMKIYVRRSVIRWLSKPHRNHGLAVVCKTCQRTNHKTIYGNKEGYMPILVFYMKQHARSHRRYKRHTQCIEGGLNCCHKEELEINFRDIGWNYIMTPETIRPSFCTGSCNGIQAAYYNHTRLMQTLRQSVLHNFASIQPCCSPVTFARPQSLLYRDNHGVVRKVDVPDLIVGECGCT